MDADGRVEGGCRFDSNCRENLNREIPNFSEEKLFAYTLYHGGDRFRSIVSRLDNAAVAQLEDTIRLLPEYNTITWKIAEAGYRQAPTAEHLILCDTAFFADLPEWVTSYAIPQELKRIGIRKYGSNGIGHYWAMKKAGKISASRRKIITVFLDDNTSLAAIENGSPLETSSGFTPLEGVPSATGCGQIDPTIVFHLCSAGYSFEEINRILTRESGFTGLRESACRYADLLDPNGDRLLAEIRDIFCYNVVKQIGAFIAALNGIDQIVFFSPRAEGSRAVIQRIIEHLIPLGLKLPSLAGGGNNSEAISAPDSPIEVLLFQYNRREAFSTAIREFLA